MLLPTVFERELLNDFFKTPFFDDKDIKKLEKRMYGADGIMKTDIKETEASYEMKIDLPGFKKENINLSLSSGYLTIHAAKETEKEHHHFLRRERCTGICERSFYVGEDISENDIKAEFKHGVLKLTLPKRKNEPEKDDSKYITIE